MTSQLSFLADPIDEAFLAFHHDNPHVYHELARLAREWKRAGHDKCEMNMLFSVLRWDSGIKTTSPDGIKVNHNFRSRYSRLLMANERDLAGFFDTRALATERIYA